MIPGRLYRCRKDEPAGAPFRAGEFVVFLGHDDEGHPQWCKLGGDDSWVAQYENFEQCERTNGGFHPPPKFSTWLSCNPISGHVGDAYVFLGVGSDGDFELSNVANGDLRFSTDATPGEFWSDFVREGSLELKQLRHRAEEAARVANAKAEEAARIAKAKAVEEARLAKAKADGVCTACGVRLPFLRRLFDDSGRCAGCALGS